MGINKAGPDRYACDQAHLRRCRFGQPMGQAGPRCRDCLANVFELGLGKRAEPDLFKEARVPAILMGQIGPFAGYGAGGACQRARCGPCQKVRKIKELPDTFKRLWQVFFDPQQLRRLHFGRNTPTHILEDRVALGVDPFGLGLSTVIHPDDDIALSRACVANADGGHGVVKNNHGAGGIKSDALDCTWGDVCLGHGGLHTRTDRTPDII